MKHSRQLAFAALAAMALTGIAAAQTAPVSQAPAAAPASTSAMTDGEIRKIDKAAKKITLRHGPIVNLDMPAMTMVFQVPDSAQLDGLATGDTVRFHAEQKAGAYVATRIEKVPR